MERVNAGGTRRTSGRLVVIAWLAGASVVVIGHVPLTHAEEVPMPATVQDNMDVALDYTPHR